MIGRSCVGLLLAIAAGSGLARQGALPVTPFAATGTIQYAFAPDDHADSMIIAAINSPRLQILVQAYSFTHRRIADALISAHRRGVEVAVLVDQQPPPPGPDMLRNMVREGVPVLVDPQHAAAHNKIIVIDAQSPDCGVVTGSLNFTYAAQHRNAENAILMRGNPPLCDAYLNNWRRHHAHSLPQFR